LQLIANIYDSEDIYIVSLSSSANEDDYCCSHPFRMV